MYAMKLSSDFRLTLDDFPMPSFFRKFVLFWSDISTWRIWCAFWEKMKLRRLCDSLKEKAKAKESVNDPLKIGWYYIYMFIPFHFSLFAANWR